MPWIAECVLIEIRKRPFGTLFLPDMKHFFSVRLLIRALGFAIALGVPLFAAHAAPLVFSTAQTISLTSPATTLTIATSSAADSLTVNAGSVAVGLSNTTGGSFVLLSPSYDLSVATSSGGGSVTISCSGGIDTATLSQNTGSALYTITASGTNCASASAPIITSITATNITTTGATITWTTNVAADSTVSYGTTSSYGATSTDATLVTSHSVSLSGLTTGIFYHYAVASAEYGTSTTSGDNTFTTASVTSGSVVNTGGGGARYSVAIENGAGTTVIPSVTLSLYGTRAYTMQVSNTSAFSGAAWIPYVTTLPWTLAPGAGTETVFAKFRDVGGEIVGSAQASIVLEPFAPASDPASVF